MKEVSLQNNSTQFKTCECPVCTVVIFFIQQAKENWEDQLRKQEEILQATKADADKKVKDGKESVRRMAQEFAEKLLKAKEELERSRNEQEVVEVDEFAETEVVPGTLNNVRQAKCFRNPLEFSK